jgi:hypothetical protein
VLEQDDVFMRWFTPAQPEGRSFDPRFTRAPFPEGDISFLHAIAPIGTKFLPAASHGPAGQLNLTARGGRTYEGTVHFRFGAPAR